MIIVTGESEKIKQNSLLWRTIFFGFDMYFSIRGYRATSSNSKNLNIGGTGVTRTNYANVNNTNKFIDTLKYYQQSRSQLTKTATEKEKVAIKKLAVQYIANHA